MSSLTSAKKPRMSPEMYPILLSKNLIKKIVNSKVIIPGINNNFL